MSKVLVIPDVHLKPRIFDQALEVMENTDCERAVCVGDLVDDWGCGDDVALYEKTLKKAIAFAQKYPDTLWCYGNHDLSYLWEQFSHPGYSAAAADPVCDLLEDLKDALETPENLAIVHRLDRVIFSHAGLSYPFASLQLYDMMDDVDCMIDTINGYGVEELWELNSPIWIRPQDWEPAGGMHPNGYMQVVGHTPVLEILWQPELELLTVDTFSTYSDGRPYGNETLCLVDTIAKTWSVL